MGRKSGKAALPSPTVEGSRVSGQLSLDGTPPAKLKPRAEEFCWQYCANGGNAAAAYRKAYRTERVKVSHANASRLLRDPAVQQRIKEIRTDRSLQLELLADYLIEFLKTVLCLDRTEFLDETGTRFRPLHELTEEARSILELRSVLTRDGGISAVPEVPKRIDAARDLARILGLYQDKLQVATAVAVVPVRRVDRVIVEPGSITALDNNKVQNVD